MPFYCRIYLQISIVGACKNTINNEVLLLILRRPPYECRYLLRYLLNYGPSAYVTSWQICETLTDVIIDIFIIADLINKLEYVFAHNVATNHLTIYDNNGQFSLNAVIIHFYFLTLSNFWLLFRHGYISSSEALILLFLWYFVLVLTNTDLISYVE